MTTVNRPAFGPQTPAVPDACPLCDACAIACDGATTMGSRWHCLDCTASWTLWPDGAWEIWTARRR